MKRDFTFINDIVSGFILAIEKTFDFEIFNLGFGQSVDLEEFITTLENKLNLKATKEYLPIQSGDVPITLSDISKAKKMLGYNPEYDTRKGISHFVEWYRDYYKI